MIIDDLVVMEKLLAHEFNTRTSDVNGACDRIKEAINGYSENRLEANIKKSFFNETSCRFWGAEVDGRAGLVRSSSLRAWPLMVITMKIAMPWLFFGKALGNPCGVMDCHLDYETANVLPPRHRL